MTAAVASSLSRLSAAPDDIKVLRQLVRDLAVCGRLLPELKPDAWKVVQLAELVQSFQNGVSSRGASDGVSVVVLRLADIKNGSVSLDDPRQLTLDEGSIEKHRLAIGDVLVIRVNGSADLVGRFVVCESSVGLPCDHFIRLRLDQTRIRAGYLKLVGDCTATRDKIQDLFVSTAGQKTVNQTHIGSLTFALPPLADQHRIVAKVNELMALCDRLEARQQDAEAAHARLVQALLDILTQARDADEFQACWRRVADQFSLLLTRDVSIDALKQVLLTLAIAGRLTDVKSGDGDARQELSEHGISSSEHPRMGWARVALGDLGEVLGGATPSKARADLWDGPIPWVSPKDMKRLEIADAEDHVTAAALDSSPLKLVPANSILMVVRGMILAHSFPVARTLAPVTINQDMKALVPPTYLVPYVLLTLRALKPQIVAEVDRSSHGTCKLTSEKLWSTEIDIPPLAEQHRIVAKINELLAMCDAVKARLAAARAKQTQLAAALTSQAVGK